MMMEPSTTIGSDHQLSQAELKVEDGFKIGTSLGSSAAKLATKRKPPEGPIAVFDEGEDAERETLKRKSTLDELMQKEEENKEKINRRDYRLYEGIVVKVMSKALADKGYKKKGVVLKELDKYFGEIEMLESKHVLRIDQAKLETVIPKIGGLVKIVNGAYRGSIARLLGVDIDQFCAKVQIEKGPCDGRVLKALEYEDICKIAQ